MTSRFQLLPIGLAFFLLPSMPRGTFEVTDESWIRIEGWSVLALLSLIALLLTFVVHHPSLLPYPTRVPVPMKSDAIASVVIASLSRLTFLRQLVMRM